MNERMKELILKAGFPKFDEMYIVTDGEELQKFAELIVQECADWIDSNVGTIDEKAQIIGDLLNHFGVE